MSERILITGGAGFIGVNLAWRRLDRGGEVVVFDDQSRAGAVANLQWLRRHPRADRLSVVRADVRDRSAVAAATAGCQVIAHLAGQVAVTHSIADPLADFAANALGTLNVLEAARQSPERPVVLYASTNKVYGNLAGLAVREEARRYAFADRPHGVAEDQPVAPRSPYACSKAAADFYALDYHRCYGVRSVVLRQSCIFGPRQFGHEDQGWVAWIARRVLDHEAVRIYGDGKQVRDLLFIDDLLEAYDAAETAIERTAGQAYNVGGGADNSISIWSEFGDWLEREIGAVPRAEYRPARPGDQLIYVSDTRKAERDFGWRPRTRLDDGLHRLIAWLREGA